MENIFIRIYSYFEKHRTGFFITFFACFALVAWFALQVRFEEDISKVLPKDKKIEKLNQVFQDSKFLDRLVIMISLKDTAAKAQPDSLALFADAWVNSVREKLSPYILKINDKIDDQFTFSLFTTINNHQPIKSRRKITVMPCV